MYTFKCTTFIVEKSTRKYSGNKIVHLQALTMQYEYFTCLLTYMAITTMTLYMCDTSCFFVFDVLVPHTNLIKSQLKFQGVPSNTGLTLSEEWSWKSQETCFMLASNRSVFTSSRYSGEAFPVKMYSAYICQPTRRLIVKGLIKTRKLV